MLLQAGRRQTKPCACRRSASSKLGLPSDMSGKVMEGAGCALQVDAGASRTRSNLSIEWLECVVDRAFNPAKRQQMQLTVRDDSMGSRETVQDGTADEFPIFLF